MSFSSLWAECSDRLRENSMNVRMHEDVVGESPVLAMNVMNSLMFSGISFNKLLLLLLW